MTTQAFPPSSSKTDVGTAQTPPGGNVMVLMKTNRYYTNGALLQSGKKYSVTAEWGKTAEERSWAKILDTATPERGTPPELTSVGKSSALRRAMRLDALVKIFGPTDASGHTFAAPSGQFPFDWATSIKQEVEAAFSAVRLVVWNRRNATLTFKGLVGVTETANNSTDSLRSTPRIGGVSYPQIAPGVTANGHKVVTFAGSASVTLAAAATAQTIAISDRIAISSVPRTVGENSSRPLLLTRGYIQGTVTPWMPSNLDYATAGNGPALLGGRVYAQTGAGADFVAAPNDMSAPAQLVCLEYAQIISFNIPVLSVWGVGDSITNLPLTTTQSLYINTWGQRACAEVSTGDKPVVWANMGAPVAGAAKYLGLARQYLAAGCPPPSVLVINPVSANDDSSNWVTAGANGVEKSREWALDTIRLAREYDIPYIIWFPLLPRETSPGGVASDTIRKALNTEMQAIAQAQGITWLDLSAIGDKAALEFFHAKYDYGDGLHQNELANTEVLVPALSAALRAILG